MTKKYFKKNNNSNFIKETRRQQENRHPEHLVIGYRNLARIHPNRSNQLTTLFFVLLLLGAVVANRVTTRNDSTPKSKSMKKKHSQ